MEAIKNVANENFDWNSFENDLDLYGNQSKEQVAEAAENHSLLQRFISMIPLMTSNEKANAAA